MSATWIVTDTNYRVSEDGLANVIYCLHWSCQDEQDGFSGRVYSTKAVSYAVGTPFTPWESVTQAVMVGWLKDAISAEAVASAEAAVAAQIEAQINPTTGTGLPPSAQ